MTQMNLVKLRSALLQLMVLACCLQSYAQEKPIDNALLWKITGKSLLKPSFLFGTIHLQDQRVFNFNDSLYSFITAADGFAMEIHPDSVVSALMQKAEDNASGKLLRQHLSKDEFKQVSRKLKKELGIDASKLTLKEAYLLKDHLSRPEAREDDMPTFVDAYLFGMARNQGKEIVGLEKAADQMYMLDDIQDDFDVKQLLKGMKKEKSFIERLVQLYIREDLQGIHNLMSFLPQETEDKLLNLRNQLMVLKMDSLIQARSYVVAVGTAHLPGKKGMIELLRQKGYQVEPVFTTTRTHANNYAIKAAQTAAWIDVVEPKMGYSLRMPGKPSLMDMLNGSMKMNMYMDLSAMKLYYAAFVVPLINVTKQNADSVLQAMCKNAMASSKGEAISRKRFAKDNFEGIDFVYKQATDKMFVRVQAIAMGKRVYLVGFGSPRQEDLAAAEADKFFNSFTLLDLAADAWEKQSFNEHFFSVALPAKAKVVRPPVGDTSMHSVQFNSMDNNRGSYFGLTVVTTNPGFLVPDDSAYFSRSVDRLQDVMLVHDLRQQDTTFEGFPARRLRARLKDGLALNCFMISRGNRVYTLSAVTSVEDSAHADVAAFFASFSFIDYPKLAWRPRQVAELGMVVPTTNAFSRTSFLDEEEDSAQSAREFQWVTYDSATATSFYVTRRTFSPYLWVKHDSVLLKKYMQDLVEEGEAVAGYSFVRNGGASAIEFTISKPKTILLQRMRLVLNGNAVYILQADAPRPYWQQHNYQQFLEGFRLAKEVKPDFLYTNSLQRLLTDLSSTDSARHAAAYNAVDELMYDSSDVPALLRAASTEYPLDSLHYYSTSSKLLQVLDGIKSTNLAELVTEHYNNLSPLQEQFKFSLLNVLARQRTERSYAAIEQLLKKGLPARGNSFEFVQILADSLLLTKKLYPYLATLSGDSLLGVDLFYLHEDMLDSNHVSIAAFKPYQHLFAKAAEHELAKIAGYKDPIYYSAGLYCMLRVLKTLNTDSSRLLLRKFLNASQTNIKCHAALQLLELKQPVDAATLQAVAADPVLRNSFYEDLKAINQEKLFPAKYLNQRSFAESYIYDAFEDSETPAKLQFIGERIALFKGKKQKFYLFKAIFTSEAQQGVLLCIGGAFSLDGKKLLAENDISGVYTDEDFLASQIDKHFKAYLALFEAYEENEEE
jgi:uncharacterized protein YbaP (TraB family)